MKKLFAEYFYIPKHGKISEKVMLCRIAVSVALIIVSLAAMSFSAYAFFAHSVSSKVSTVRSASYELDVTSPDAEAADGVFILNNDTEKDVSYKFTISCSEDSTASVGYCKIAVITDVVTDETIKLENGAELPNVQLFYTEPIWANSNGDVKKPEERTVTVVLPAGKSMSIRFIAEWGSCTKEPIITETVAPISFEKVGPSDNSDTPLNDPVTDAPNEPTVQDEEETSSDISSEIQSSEDAVSSNVEETVSEPVTSAEETTAATEDIPTE